MNGMKIIMMCTKMNTQKYCYENKKYAFLSDYARLQIISREGGIYLILMLK